ncbi:RLA class I histocompatibility antigen, alpha chain 11/11-like [Clarias gariepinus]
MGKTNVTVVGLLNGQLLFNYDGKMKTLNQRLECLNGSYKDVWKHQKDLIQGNEQDLRPFLSAVMKDFKPSEGLHTWQWMFGCELYNNTSTVYDQSCYDGEHVITLDPQNLNWTTSPTSSDEARALKKSWEATGHHAVDHKHTLEKKCTELLNHFKSCCKNTIDIKVHPEVSLFQKHSPSQQVVCHATGFFPKAVMITWQKDGEDVHEDVELRKTLPNQDGSFQKRSILRVPAEELQKHNYTCVVQHSSLEMEIRKEVPKGKGSDRRTVAIIIGVLMALVAFVAGIMVWKKKKNSGGRSE